MTAPVVTREQCGLRPVANLPTNITPGGPDGGSTAHYNGPSPGGYPWPHSRCPSIWRADQAYHMDHNGWLDIAYTGGVCIHGYIFEGRWFGHRTAANGSNDGNQRSYAFCYMAGQGDPFTDEAKRAMVDAFDLAIAAKAGPNVWPHKHWFSTSCPGDPVEKWIAASCPVQTQAVPAGPPSTVPVPAHAALAAPIVAMVPTHTGGGYLLVGADGGIFAYGDAAYHGSLPQLNVRPSAPIIGGGLTPSGGGYWLVGADGGVYAFGDALFKGSMGGKHLNQPVSGFAPTPSGAGYWLTGTDGGIFAFGDAPFVGSPV